MKTIKVTATSNGGGVKWTNTFDSLDAWVTAVRESHPDDRLWEPLDWQLSKDKYPTTEEWLDVANEIAESADACTITITIKKI